MIKKDVFVEFRNPKKRALSQFMAEQLLYDYAIKRLDPKRENSVKEALENSPVLAKTLDDIIYGMTYCHHLQKTKISQELLTQLQSPLTLKSKLRFILNPRTWNQSLPWAFEAISLSLIVIIISYFVPWLKLESFLKNSTNKLILVSEIPKDSNYNTPSETSLASLDTNVKVYQSIAELKTVNPDFTANKLSLILPRIGASIEHQSLKKSSHGVVSPYFRISIPKSQTEALMKELKSQGQLTWTTPPSENEKGSIIFGMELWLILQTPQKAKTLSKDSNEE